MSDTKLVQVELDTEVVERLDFIADLEYTSRSALIREALLREVQKEERVNDDIATIAVLKFSQDAISKTTLERIVGAESAQMVDSLTNHMERRDDIIEDQAKKISQTDDDELLNPPVTMDSDNDSE